MKELEFQLIIEALQHKQLDGAIEAFQHGLVAEQESELEEEEHPRRRELIEHLKTLSSKQPMAGQTLEDFERHLLADFIVDNLFEKAKAEDAPNIEKIVKYFAHIVENNVKDNEKTDVEAAHLLYDKAAKKAEGMGLGDLNKNLIEASPKTQANAYKADLRQLKIKIWDAIIITQSLENQKKYNESLIGLNDFIGWLAAQEKFIHIDNEGNIKSIYKGSNEVIKNMLDKLSEINLKNDIQNYNENISSSEIERREKIILNDLIQWMFENDMVQLTPQTLWKWEEINNILEDLTISLDQHRHDVSFDKLVYIPSLDKYSLERQTIPEGEPVFSKTGQYINVDKAIKDLCEMLLALDCYYKHKETRSNLFNEDEPMIIDLKKYNEIAELYQSIAKIVQIKFFPGYDASVFFDKKTQEEIKDKEYDIVDEDFVSNNNNKSSSSTAKKIINRGKTLAGKIKHGPENLLKTVLKIKK